MLAVATPNTPLFAEVFNPYIKLTELVGCPDVGDTIAVEHWFFEYFYDVNESDREEILASFDKLGYYETVEDGCIVTIFPQTDNKMVDDSDDEALSSIHDFCAHVSANARRDGLH
tara:strand:+ start:127 stop:471 length:345 start_codon:yes stop_codon:yes gene_type:complete